MAATVGTAGSGEPDMALIGELLEDISRNPPAIAARKLLVEHYITIGWLDAAMENAQQLKKDASGDQDVQRLLAILEKKPEPPAVQLAAKTTSAAAPVIAVTAILGRKQPKKKTEQPAVHLSGTLDSARQDFTQGHENLRVKAKLILADLLNLRVLQKNAGLPQSQNTARIQAIAENGNTSARPRPQLGARTVARDIQRNSEKATEMVILDLESMLTWARDPGSRRPCADDDAVRDALVARVRALESALPADLKVHCELGFLHVEHENLGRNYANTETMLGDPVKEIPRDNFYVTEDNYAWDMEELAQAITANGGIMRNPLSKDMFTTNDVRGILVHPHGKKLAAMQVEQREMSKGVRPETITQLDALAKALLGDQTSDAIPSRHAVDEFLAYTATLPALEQKAIDNLKCPAKDKHTGQSYDFTIGEAVRDAKGNRVCFHKTGDFAQQAAAYLRQNRGAPPNEDKCGVM